MRIHVWAVPQVPFQWMEAVVSATATTPNPAVAAGRRAAQAMSGATPYSTAGTNDGAVVWSTMRTVTNHRVARPAPNNFLRRSPVSVIRVASSYRRRSTALLGIRAAR